MPFGKHHGNRGSHAGPRHGAAFSIIAVLMLCTGSPAGAESGFLGAVRTFADQVLDHGRDRYGERHSPLFADGLDVTDLSPAVWRYDGDEIIISNFASQQHLMRTLVGLSALTGDPGYREAAVAAAAHMFEHHRAECGLLYWGGHQIVDLRTNRNRGDFDADCHEFKNNFPFYHFLWEVDSDATQKLLQAIWNAHIVDWSRLDMNRHGSYGTPLDTLWDHDFVAPDPFFEGDGLTFINAGNDLIYAGGILHELTGSREALTWTLRLAGQYVRARHPETGLGVYQYSQPRRREAPPDDPEHPRFTWSTFGDRAQRQLGPEFGEVALEGNLLDAGRANSIYGYNALIQLHLAERLDGDEAAALLDWTVDGLVAYHRYGYDAETHTVRPLLADGTDLTGFKLKRPGYYGPAGRKFERSRVHSLLMLSYARAYRLAGRTDLRTAVRDLAAGFGLGDIGEDSERLPELNPGTDAADVNLLFALLELHRAEPREAYLELAEQLAGNILERSFHDGWFLPGPRHRYTRFDAPEPLALLTLEAIRRGSEDQIPAYVPSRGYIHGRFDGHGRTYDTRVIWPQQRSD